MDRVNYTFGMKIPGKVEYSSLNFSASLSSDVLPGESVEDAFDRVRKLVMVEVDKDFETYG